MGRRGRDADGAPRKRKVAAAGAAAGAAAAPPHKKKEKKQREPKAVRERSRAAAAGGDVSAAGQDRQVRCMHAWRGACIARARRMHNAVHE
eukprot:359309-Chlamydomonas_euryale.AAC.4